jgi:hypothetical protein
MPLPNLPPGIKVHAPPFQRGLSSTGTYCYAHHDASDSGFDSLPLYSLAILAIFLDIVQILPLLLVPAVTVGSIIVAPSAWGELD